MNISRLHEILNECAVLLRRGPMIEVQSEQRSNFDRMRVVTVNAMPHASERPDLKQFDMVLVKVGVDQAKAEQHRAELAEILATYPEPDRLAGGPSFIEVGAVIDSQGAAFQLFAVGQALGFWNVVTPVTLGMEGAEADLMAGNGWVMTTGYRPGAPHAG